MSVKKGNVKKAINTAALAVMFFFGVGICAGAPVVDVDAAEARDWLDYVLPLPQKIAIPAKRAVKPYDLRIILRNDATDIEQNAGSMLRDFITERSGVTPDSVAPETAFYIVMGVLDADGQVAGRTVSNAGRLRDLPNHEQAYLIEPKGKNEIIIAGLTPEGVYYGMHTFRQLLAREISSDTVTIPMARITDWPALACRGLWNCPLDMYRDMAAVKLNYTKNYAAANLLAVQPPASNGTPRPIKYYYTNGLSRSKALFDAGRLHAFHHVPNITHVNFWSRHHMWEDLLRWYPGLAGASDTVFQAGPERKNYWAPCPLHPMFEKIIADTLRVYAAAGFDEVSVWTTEFYSYCSCSNCIPPGGEPRQFILESRAIVAAWETVKKQYPNFKVRIFGLPLGLSRGRAADVDEAVRQTASDAWQREWPVIMEELPAEVMLESVYGWNRAGQDATAATGRHRMVDFAVGDGIAHLFSGIPIKHARLQKTYKQRWIGAVPWFYFSGRESEQSVRFASNMIMAIAEWAWNPDGRDPEAFFRAWATVTGRRPVARVVEWCRLATQYDDLFYGSGSLRWEKITAAPGFMQDIADKIKTGTALPATLWHAEAIQKRADVERDITEMVTIARELDDPYFLITSEHLFNLYRQMFALYDFAMLWNNQAESSKIRTMAVVLDEAIGSREQSYQKLSDLYRSFSRDKKTIPYVYTMGTAYMTDPDFDQQRKILKEAFAVDL